MIYQRSRHTPCAVVDGTRRVPATGLPSWYPIFCVLPYSQDTEALQITLPPKAPYACCAYPIKLTFSGAIPKLKPAAKLLWQAQARDISGDEDRSAYGLPAESGVLLLAVPADSAAARAGLQKDDAIIACNGTEVKMISDMRALADKARQYGRLDQATPPSSSTLNPISSPRSCIGFI